MKENILKDKSYSFAIRIVKQIQYINLIKRNMYYQNSYYEVVLQLVH